jgi:uncharacterized protein (TIGR03437 family)
MIWRRIVFSVTLGTAIFSSMPIGRAEIKILAVTSSTDFQSATIAPGSLESIWCTGLTGIQGVVDANGPVLPTQLAGISVYAGGAANAPILAIADLGGYQLINIQIPWDAAGLNTIAVSQGQEKATATVTGWARWPVFFVTGSGYLVARHASDYSLVAPENPARPGEWIVGYASNLGPVANTPPSGAVAPNSPLSPLAPSLSGFATDYSVVITPPGVPPTPSTGALESNFMGLAPGTVGVYQINFRIPNTAAVGDGVVYMRETVFCGFFFVPGCGRGLMSTFSASVKLPIAH